MKFKHAILIIASCSVLSLLTNVALGQIGNAWHIPDNNSDLGGTYMRNPRFEIGASTIVTNYQGVYKGDGANQTGGWLIYRGISGTTTGAWASVVLAFDNNSGQNQYWRGSFNTSAFNVNAVIQYYFKVVFSNRSDTYVYGSDSSHSTTGTESTAQANPFSFRNRPAWIFHANNRVVNGQDVQFWVKAGYVSKDDTLRWADNGAVYYTTDGTAPAGTRGTPSGTTVAVPMSFDRRENDSSIAGNGMWWVGTALNLPTFTNIRYRIGLWNSGNNEEKFADYNTSGTNNNTFTFSIGALGDPVLTVNGLSANYTTTKLFVDEVAGDSIPLTIIFEPGVGNIETVEVFTNLNRRDRAGLDANGDGIEDGIQPPDGNLIVAGNDLNYYKAYTMSLTATPGRYSLTLSAQKTGAYRLTSRYKVNGNPNWVWYSSGGRRDHAIVVSPKKARDIVMYELNTLNVSASGSSFAQRSTFEDMWDSPARTQFGRFDLNYARGLGINWLWFQPVHAQGVDGREIDPATSAPYEVGSPYAVKNFFEIMPLMSKANTRSAAMGAFTNFVNAADATGVNIMLDAAFNHTAHDCELAQAGVDLWAPTGGGGWAATDEIRNREARFYSRTADYCQRATSASNIAVAPDRGDFGKWNDVKDVYFGRYAALVCQNPSDNGNYLNEGDWFDYTTTTGSFDATTRNVWRYFAEYILYWLDKTGHPAGTPASQSHKGIDGLRADFGQGLPPQAWEYIINKSRSRKWDFVFMAETLDAGAPSYRSNRHFDILNENIIFALQGATSTSAYRDIYEQRRQSFGQGLVLLNTVSHDEANYSDPWEAVIRYAAGSSIDGAPMIFYGQELGIASTFGFDRYELNFGKMIPHFKKYNSMMPIWNDTDFGNDQLYPVYAAINKARENSRALRSSNRYFLDQTGGGGTHQKIFSVAKYQVANGSPATSDVVFAFANLDRNNNQSGNFNVNITQNSANLFGIKAGRTYNVKNIAAYSAQNNTRSNQWLWGAGITGADVLNNGVFVLMKKVPTSVPAWSTDPYEAQYLKLYDVTPPPAPGTPGTAKAYAIGIQVTFNWSAANDPEGGVAIYRLVVTTCPGGATVFDGNVGNVTSYSVYGAVGQTLCATVHAISTAGVQGAASSTSSGVPLLSPTGDEDGDGLTNEQEDLAGTNPLNAGSSLRISSVRRLANGDIEIVWDSVTGRIYDVYSATGIAGAYGCVSCGTFPSGIVAGGVSTSFTNPAPVSPSAFYKVKLR